MARFKVCFVLLLVFNISFNDAAKLNVPRVLIPLFNELQVNFMLEVTEGGCYQWSSSRDDVVIVKPLLNPNGCSSSARVTSAARLSHRNTAIILAEDVHTKQVLRCDVIVDNIVKLDVITTTRELYVEEAPEAFEIVAYDNQGNEFTTLEGVDFTWTLISPLKDSEVIKIMNFADSSYKASDSLKTLEARGLRGHTALLEGVRTGAAKVIMRLPHKEYANVNTVEVVLRVVANLLLVPSEASILEGDSVHFKIVQVKEGRLIELTLSPQYSLEIEHSEIALLHPKTGVATAKVHGQTRVFLRDAGADEDTPDFRPPEAILRVGTARRLQLAGRPTPPSKPWALQKGQPFSIHVQMLDSEDRFMHIGPMTQISVTLDSNLFQVHGRTQNGSVVDGLAMRSGKVGIAATLMSVAGKIVYPKISTTGEMVIYDGIELIPSNLILSISSVRPEFQMMARGGDGSYTWQREGSAITVDRQGHLTGLEVGKATVIASLPNNPHINATASVRVVETSGMEVVWNEGEAPVGSMISLHVALYARIDSIDSVAPVTSCDNTPFNVQLIDGVEFEYTSKTFRTYPNELKYGDACTILHVKCTEIGSITANIIHGNLRREVVISCHKPLTRVYPPMQHQALILAVGSSANIIYTGGPNSWSSDLEPTHNITVLDEDIATGVLYKPMMYSMEYTSVFTVTCLKLGQTEIDMRILRGDTGIHLASAKLSVQCNSPHALRITLRQPSESSCPIIHPSQVRVLSSSRPLTLEISVADIKGNIFHNASSLRITWSSTPSFLAQQQLAEETILTQLDEGFHPIPVVAYHYRTMVVSEDDLRSLGGVGEVIGEVVGYWNHILKEVGVTRTPHLSETPRASITLRSVMPLQVAQDKLIFYNTPSNEGVLPMYHGSGHVDVHITPTSVLKYQIDKSGQFLKLQILREGSAMIVFKDKCLPSPAAVVQVSVVSAYGILSDLPPLIEKGASVECKAYLTDRIGSPLPANIIGAPNITAMPVNVAGQITVVGPVMRSGEAFFKVSGIEEGDARVDFSSLSLSSSSPTHVFPPLRIVPPSSVLLRGSTLALMTSGGPPPPSTIVFSHPSDLQQSNIARIHPSGIFEALAIGSAKVEAHAELGSVSYGHATALVKIINLDGVSIHAPTPKLLLGNSMPLWATGISDSVGPLELGSQSSLHFTWSVSGDGGAVIYDVLADTNIEIEDKDRVSVRLQAVQAGRVKIHLNVTTDRASMIFGNRHTWSSTLDLMFVDPLQLISPIQSSANLLLAPNSNTLLETNYRPDKVTYRIIDEESSTLVSVNSAGILTSYSRLGKTVLVISGMDSKLETQQHITLTVEVVPVSYVMLDISSKPKFDGLQALPQGLRLSVVAKRFDSLGRHIAGLTTNLGHYTTRSDIIHAKFQSNSSLEIVLLEPGRSVFKITDVDSEFSDYVLLNVSPAIYPAQFVATVGDCWCSRSGVSKATWSSSNPKSLTVSESGLVQVLADGPAPAQVYLSAQGVDLQATSSVQIRHADRIMFLDGKTEHIFTDEKPYIVPLIIFNHEENNKLTNVLSTDTDCLSQEITTFPFECEVKHNADNLQLAQVQVEPVLDIDTKRYGCRLTWTPSLSLQPQDAKHGNHSSDYNSANARVTVIAKISPSVTAQTQARAVRAANPTTMTLNLSPPPALAAQLDIIAPIEVLMQLKVESDTKILSVSSPDKISEIMSRYIVSGKRANSKGVLRSHINVVSALTNQNIEIPVNFGSGNLVSGDICPSGGASPLMTLLEQYFGYIISLAILIVTVLISMCLFNRHIRPSFNARHISVATPPGYDGNTPSSLRNMASFTSSSSQQSMSPQQSITSQRSMAQLSPSTINQFSPIIPKHSTSLEGDISVYDRRRRRFI